MGEVPTVGEGVMVRGGGGEVKTWEGEEKGGGGNISFDCQCTDNLSEKIKVPTPHQFIL